MTVKNMQRLHLTTLQLAGIIVVAALFTQCQRPVKGAFTVTVAYSHLDKMAPAETGGAHADSLDKTPRILLEAIPYGGEMTPVILDSGTLTKNSGEVVLKGNGAEEGIFQLAVNNGPVLLLINDEDKIKVDLDLSKTENYYTVTGSDASVQLKDFIRQYSEKTLVVNKAFAGIDSLKQLVAPDSMMIVATGKKNSALSSLNSYLHDFINRSRHPALSLFALGWSSRSFPQDEFEKTLTEVVSRFPEHEMLKKLRTMYDMQKAQAAQEKPVADSWVGKPAPDLSLPDATGKLISIQSFRGKYLLVDFWASWCGPCRQENPNVVKAYNAFKNKNFTILGVSLDKEKDPWQQAIKDDQLAWTHISDLKFWNSKAVDIFHFDGIPFNVLIAPDGKVIAENLRGFDLEKKLQEVLK